MFIVNKQWWAPLGAPFRPARAPTLGTWSVLKDDKNPLPEKKSDTFEQGPTNFYHSIVGFSFETCP